MNENVFYINAKSDDADVARFMENLRTRRFVIAAEQPEIVRLGKWESYLTNKLENERGENKAPPNSGAAKS